MVTDPQFSRDGMGAHFMTQNRSKQGVSINLHIKPGHQVVYDLVRQADVMFDNFGTGVTRRLCIDPNTLTAINQRNIPRSVTGFGETGSNTKRPPFD
ncbi:CoA transferase [Rhodoferax ferrireducens]|uniref:CoA transferase n=1 Tax=Rhodoferax ferrireducens TaxID=192843 RepID=UPI0002E89420|nr:CoA transferase [Rhodoferax ferrireducens]